MNCSPIFSTGPGNLCGPCKVAGIVASDIADVAVQIYDHEDNTDNQVCELQIVCVGAALTGTVVVMFSEPVIFDIGFTWGYTGGDTPSLTVLIA